MRSVTAVVRVVADAQTPQFADVQQVLLTMWSHKQEDPETRIDFSAGNRSTSNANRRAVFQVFASQEAIAQLLRLKPLLWTAPLQWVKAQGLEAPATPPASPLPSASQVNPVAAPTEQRPQGSPNPAPVSLPEAKPADAVKHELVAAIHARDKTSRASVQWSVEVRCPLTSRPCRRSWPISRPTPPPAS